MLLAGFNHVAVLTRDTDRLHTFSREVFDAEVFSDLQPEPGLRLSFVRVGPVAMLNVFEVDGNAEAERQTPMCLLQRRLDHLALEASSQEAFDTIRPA